MIWLRRRTWGSRALSLALYAVRLADVRARRAQANSLARMAKPTKIAAQPGPGSRGMSRPASRTVDPTVNTASRQAVFSSGLRRIHSRHAVQASLTDRP